MTRNYYWRLASLVRGRLHSQSEIIRVPYEEVYGQGFEDMFRRVPSLVKLERLIGYRPRTPLETVIDVVRVKCAPTRFRLQPTH